MPSAAATALLLASLSTARAGQPSVDVVPVGLRDVELGLGGASFDLLLEVTRTRGLPVRLRRLDYALEVGQVEITEASSRYEDVRLRRGEPVEIAVPVRLDAGEALAVAFDALRSGRLEVSLSGRAGVRVLLFPVTVPFEAGLVGLDTR